jgi:hypothetical protein
MMRRLRLPRRHRSRPRPFAGQSIVEFALVSLVLFMMTFGIIDLGRAVMTRSMLTNALREAARYGSINPTDNPGILAAARSTSPTLNLTSVTVKCYQWLSGGWSVYPEVAGTRCGTASRRDRLEVSASYSFGLIAPRLFRMPPIEMQESAKTLVQ